MAITRRSRARAAAYSAASSGPALSSSGRRRRVMIREACRMDARFTAAHRGGEGPPLVLVHGFTGSWRIWDLVLPALERRHEVLAPTLPGHAGGPPVAGAM